MPAIPTLPYALTTPERIKQILVIPESNTGWDTVLGTMVAECTEYIETTCNREFASRTGDETLNTYNLEVYDGGRDYSEFLVLRQAPVSQLPDPLDPHGSVSLFQFRSGSPQNPVWTDMPLTNWELHRNGTTGLIRVYGGLYQGTNNLRVTYVAGYKINWANQYDRTKHTLPLDLTALCERMVIKMFKRRESYGKISEAAGEGVSTNWRDAVEVEDQQVLDNYSRTNFF